MMEERYHATTQNRFYPGMSNVNKILQWRQNLSAHLRIIEIQLPPRVKQLLICDHSFLSKYYWCVKRQLLI